MVSNQQNNQYEYFAFISYKREDEKWAKRLQKKLESYRLPIALRKENPALPNKIRPVFRDQSELSGGNLKTEIEKGLNSSKYLIVICSPHSAKSTWVSKEVQHFISQGREEYIIPFIIGGTPNAINPEDECFPEGLRQLTGEKEILGININEMGRDVAIIKVIARMFSLRFDSLWQRFRRIKRKRMIIISTLILFLWLFAISFAIILWTNNKTINNQNEQLITLIKSLEEENKTFSHLRTNTERYSFAGSLRGNDSKEFLINVAYHPYEPIIAFSDDWGYWIHYIQSNLEVCLPTNDNPNCVLNAELLGFTRNGDEIVASSWGGLYVWDATSFQLTHNTIDYNLLERIANEKFDLTENNDDEYLNLDSINKISGNIFSLNNNQILATKHGKTIKTTISYQNQEYIRIIYNKMFNEALFIGQKRAVLYDYDQNEFIQFFKGFEDNSFSFSPSGEYLRIGKDLFVRNILPDTISDLNYTVHSNYFNQTKRDISKDYRHNIIIIDNTITYSYDNEIKKIEVIRNSNMGNGQEYLSDAIFLEPNKIVAIVEQGKHRIYNAQTGNLLGAVPSYIWDGNQSMGHEEMLGHGESNIASYKIINRDLYVVSSGAILRIYDIDKIRLKRVIELPYRFDPGRRLGAIENCEISEDGSSVKYAFDNDNITYSCILPQ